MALGILPALYITEVPMPQPTRHLATDRARVVVLPDAADLPPTKHDIVVLLIASAWTALE